MYSVNINKQFQQRTGFIYILINIIHFFCWFVLLLHRSFVWDSVSVWCYCFMDKLLCQTAKKNRLKRRLFWQGTCVQDDYWLQLYVVMTSFVSIVVYYHFLAMHWKCLHGWSIHGTCCANWILVCLDNLTETRSSSFRNMSCWDCCVA